MAGRQLHGDRRVHLLLSACMRVRRLDLPVAALQPIQELGHGGERHRVVRDSVAHVGRVQELALVRHDLGGLLAVEHREVVLTCPSLLHLLCNQGLGLVIVHH